ncbi:hypothetical protein HPB49_004709 [Dermacentor silvarum]|uniref:Uncharacterized protein n=1 Tax=Dermacentor silvarum TaxID=543639 RepID=A0ACB8DB06_DERSI|nr:hypothetical protein HPB49_004709 [Dermacentor silvarum]
MLSCPGLDDQRTLVDRATREPKDPWNAEAAHLRAERDLSLYHFCGPLRELGVRKDVTGIRPFQRTHVWLIKLRTPEAKEVLVNTGGFVVKGRFCAVVDPVQQDITLKVHWVPFHVTGEALKRTFDHYGEVKEVRQEDWKAEQVASDAEKVVTPSASTQDDTAGRKQRQRRINEEGRTPPAIEDADHGRDALNVEMDVEPDTPYETPDEMATEEPATLSKPTSKNVVPNQRLLFQTAST